jgi:hypothetical protein
VPLSTHGGLVHESRLGVLRLDRPAPQGKKKGFLHRTEVDRDFLRHRLTVGPAAPGAKRRLPREAAKATREQRQEHGVVEQADAAGQQVVRRALPGRQ